MSVAQSRLVGRQEGRPVC